MTEVDVVQLETAKTRCEDSQNPIVIIPGTPPDFERLGPTFQRLCEVIAKLRSPAGCPWDRIQTLASIKPYTLEETYELLEAIDSNDNNAIAEELGDVLLQVVLDSQIAADEGRFDLTNVVTGLTAKMIERHPHVFGDAKASTPGEVSQNWDRIKQKEKQRDSVFDGLPADLPALARAARLSSKAARAGYDFPARDMLFDKLREEMNELAEELFPNGQTPSRPATVDAHVEPDPPPFDSERQKRIEGELGDVLFVLANIARRWHINPEEALRASNSKFQRRVQYIERRLKEQSRSLKEATLAEQEELYQEGKRLEKR